MTKEENLFERDRAKKIIPTGGSNYLCPSCGRIALAGKFCAECGQRLDWDGAKNIEDSISELTRHLSNIEKIAMHYGWQAQSRQCIEEMAELTVAINKEYRAFKKYGPHIEDIDEKEAEKIMLNVAEEIADVSLMLTQLQILADCFAEVNQFQRQKVKRMLERMENED